MVSLNSVAISQYDDDQYPSISNLKQPALVNDLGWNFHHTNGCVTLISLK